MFFIKKLILGLAAVILIYVGGNGTQSSNLLFQGGGFVGMRSEEHTSELQSPD